MSSSLVNFLVYYHNKAGVPGAVIAASLLGLGSWVDRINGDKSVPSVWGSIGLGMVIGYLWPISLPVIGLLELRGQLLGINKG